MQAKYFQNVILAFITIAINILIIIVITFQILVSVLNPLSPKKAPVEEPIEDQTQPTITLEVFMISSSSSQSQDIFFTVFIVIFCRFPASPTQLVASVL